MRYRGKLSLSFPLALEYLGVTVLWEKANLEREKAESFSYLNTICLSLWSTMGKLKSKMKTFHSLQKFNRNKKNISQCEIKDSFYYTVLYYHNKH